MAPRTRTSITPGRSRQRDRPAASHVSIERDLGEPLAIGEQIERGIGGGAGECIGHEGRAMHQGLLGSSDQKASKICGVATVAASGSVPPVSAFDRVTMSGVTPGRLAGEHRAGAAEAGEDFVEDQQHAVPVGERAQPPQHLGLMEAHAARALHQRLDDDGGDRVGILAPASRSSSASEASSSGSVADQMLLQKPGKLLMNAGLEIARSPSSPSVSP